MTNDPTADVVNPKGAFRHNMVITNTSRFYLIMRHNTDVIWGRVREATVHPYAYMLVYAMGIDKWQRQFKTTIRGPVWERLAESRDYLHRGGMLRSNGQCTALGENVAIKSSWAPWLKVGGIVREVAILVGSDAEKSIDTVRLAAMMLKSPMVIGMDSDALYGVFQWKVSPFQIGNAEQLAARIRCARERFSGSAYLEIRKVLA